MGEREHPMITFIVYALATISAVSLIDLILKIDRAEIGGALISVSSAALFGYAAYWLRKHPAGTEAKRRVDVGRSAVSEAEEQEWRRITRGLSEIIGDDAQVTIKVMDALAIWFADTWHVQGYSEGGFRELVERLARRFSETALVSYADHSHPSDTSP